MRGVMERLDAFMERANAAYYATHDPFRDFTTAPEVSQVFGELLGLWAAATWQAMGSPMPVLLAEAGPGRGTLMQDALRAIGRAAPAFAAAVRALGVHFVETSPRLRAHQAARVPDARWVPCVEDLPRAPLLLLANEFLDALPIRQFVRRARWMERFVEDGAFAERDTGETLPDAAEGTIAERCDGALAFAAHVGARVAADGGAALVLDYGPQARGIGDTLQALRNGQPADPLADPGAADLTAHVDFAAVAERAREAGAAVHGPVPQGRFLVSIGLFQRARTLAESQPARRAAALMAGAQRLAQPERMGALFKVLALCDPRLPVPAGFEA